jgi:ATP-dependent DNA helicase DinG
MAEAVEAALTARRHLIVEAGTGVGKSFAYLVPALLWAERTGKKVAVATSTIALQEQLVERDLPTLSKALPFPTSFTLVKGRGNYLCLRRATAAAAGSGDLFPDAERREEIARILAWGAAGGRSRQELPFVPREDVWDAVRAESGNCLHAKCPHFEVCGYQAARRAAQSARLLVMNHHVLLADLAMRRSGSSFLPRVDAIVIDEAHDLEDTAAEALGARLSRRGLAQSLGRIWNPRRRTGLLARHADPALRELAEAAGVAGGAWFDGVRELAKGPSTVVEIAAPLPVSDALPEALDALAAGLERGVESAADRDAALELEARARGFRALSEGVAALAAGPAEGAVAWAETDARGNEAVVRSPIDVGPGLREVLYAEYGTVVLTSATLSTGRPPSFRFARERLGLSDAEELSVGSPFDYPRRARLVVRTDLPDPARDPAAFEAALPEAVLEAVRRTNGGAFVLFTSYESMRRTAAAVRARFEGDGLLVLVQGEDLPRTAMLERFRAENAVLFGVSSFWQGVDVPGDALRNVVVARLPFDVPTHPLQRARHRRLEVEGRSAFEELSLPSAAIRLKQGFGRLIRRATDRGVVFVLDPRLVTKRYGRTLLESLPECPVSFEPEAPGA